MVRSILILLLLLSSSAFAINKQEMPLQEMPVQEIHEQKMPVMHHPFDITPSKSITVPDSFPLNEDSQLDCQTCHGIKDLKQQDFEKINKKTADFFREGPYEKLTDFCFRCHDRKPYQRDNIHKMLDDKGKIIKNSCLYCHQETPDADKESDSETESSNHKLRLPAQNICYGCHLKTPHFNALNHQQKPDEDMLERINSYEHEHKIIFPLSDDGKIMCVTCHSPHQLDVIDREKPAGKQVENNDIDEGISYSEHSWNTVFMEDKKARLDSLKLEKIKKNKLNYQHIEKEILLRLPAKDGTLCLVCHEFEK